MQTTQAQLPVKPTGGRRRRSVAILAALATATFGLTALASPAGASLAQTGPIDPTTGYPSYFADASGVRLKLCLDPAEGCIAAPVARPNDPISLASGNFPDESFYFEANTAVGKLGLYQAALEAAFSGTSGDVVDGEQIGFARTRIRMTGLVAGRTYHITHPYGVIDLVAEADVTGAGFIRYVNDRGCLAEPCGTFQAMGDAFIADARLTSAPWLTQVGAAAGTLGDSAIFAPVTGSPFGTDFVRVEGPNAGGPGIDVLETDQFAVQGLLSDVSDGAPSTPDLSDASDSGRSATDNITNVTTPTFTGTATDGATVEVLDGATVVASGPATGGAYSLSPAAPLADGVHNLTARIANPLFDPVNAPNEPQYLVSGKLSIRVDTAGPASTINAPKPSNPTADNTPTFNFSSGDANATFECSLKTGADLYDTCVSPLTYDAQFDGLYTFKVKATDQAGNTGAPATYTFQIGNPVTVPGAPTGVTATPKNASATVTWTPPTNSGGATITSYTVDVLPLTGAPAVAPVTVSGTSATVTGLVNGEDYAFTVKATNSAGTGPSSAQSNTVTPASVPGAPQIGTASPGNASATVRWLPPANDGGSLLTGYQIRTFIGVTRVGTQEVTNAAATQATVSGLTNGTAYTFKVLARNSVGLSAASAASNAVTPTAATVPGAPTIGTAVAGNTTDTVVSATAKWTAPASNGGSAITSYVVTARRVSNGALTSRSTTNVGTLKFGGLVSGASYQFRVQAVNAVGTSASSALSNSVIAR